MAAECKVIRGGEGFHGKQGLDYFAGVSAQSAGARGICMHMAVIPPGAEAKPHYHEAHETAIFQIEGSTSFRHGPNLEFTDVVNEGDYVYIIARTDPNEQESVVLI